MNQTLFSTRWYDHPGKDLDVVISTRMRLARNMIDYAFPGKMTRDDENAVSARVMDAVARVRDVESLETVEVSGLPSVERRVLVEEGLIGQPYSLEAYRVFAMSADASLAILPNDTDHLRMAAFAPGLDMAGPMGRLEALDSAFEEFLPYSATLENGYVTTELNSMGTGMRASLLLHLPALSDTGLIEKAVKGILAEGLGVRGFYGGEGQSSGALYQVSNSVSIGDSEQGIAEKVEAAARRLIQYERLAREELAEKDHERLLDRIARAYATVCYARTMAVSECFELLSRLRLGIALGWIQGAALSAVDGLYYRLQKAALQSESASADDPDRGGALDLLRARKLRAFGSGCSLVGVE
jgi:protein arginine kinase